MENGKVAMKEIFLREAFFLLNQGLNLGYATLFVLTTWNTSAS